MTEDEQVFGPVLEQLQALEADADSVRMVRSVLITLRSNGVAINFDAVLAYFDKYQGRTGASISAALIVRENNRQEIAEALAAVPAGTAH